MKSISVTQTFLVSICCFFPVSAFAGLIQSSPFELSMHGTGFGNVDTLITLQTQNGNVTSEAGCIGFGGATDECGINQVGNIKNSSSTQPLPLGLTNAGDLRFVFNASEPAASSMNLNQLEVSFYGTSKTALFTAWLTAPITLTSTVPGVGNSGFAFELDSAATAQANAVLSSVTRIGAGFAATNASGGPDTLYLARAAAPSGSATPEPASCALLGAGMVAIGLLARRTRKARKG